MLVRAALLIAGPLLVNGCGSCAKEDPAPPPASTAPAVDSSRVGLRAAPRTRLHVGDAGAPQP